VVKDKNGDLLADSQQVDIHLEHPISTKTVRRDLHKFNNQGTVTTAKPLITESKA
jgi:DeoR/GlpR family transcriptional regulator of sugar metabolism